MASFKRKNQRFACTGVCLTRPRDAMDAGKYPYLKNVRSVQQGVIQPRDGYTATDPGALGQTDVHSIRRLNDPSPSASPAWTRIIGAGTKLYSGQGPYVEQDTGYSGDPLSMVPFRPERSPQAWMYVADRSKMRKIRADGTNYVMGVAPPLTAPDAALADFPPANVISDFEATAGWTNSGTAGAVSLQTRVNTTIAAVLYDSGSTGWCTVQPTVADESIQPGEFLLVGGAETVVVEEVNRAISATTIAAIAYDTGAAGLCTIQLANPTDGLERNSIILLGGTERVRVLSVTLGPDGLYSLRCSTVGTFAATNAVSGLPAFRAFFVSNHAAGAALATSFVQSTIAAGIGKVAKTQSNDLSKINDRPTQGDDIIHISIQVDNLANVTEGKILLDCDGATNDFTQNFFFYTFRANDLVPAATNRLSVTTTTQTQIQTGLIDPNSQQTGTGASQWSELKLRVKDLTRVGTDLTRGLANIAAVGVQMNVSASTVCGFDAWHLRGSYGPNVSDDGTSTPVQYRFRYRSSLTGAKSLASPATRYGVLPHRQRVHVTFTVSADAQVDKVDVERTGGALTDWHYVGTAANGGGAYFDDDLDDFAIQTNAPLETDAYQPFPIVDLPKSGVCNVAGTTVTRVSGDNFNTAWARGTQIKVDGIPYELYAQPGSTSVLQTSQNIGAKTSVAWTIDEPVLLGQPLPVMWGPYGDGDVNLFMFGVGDTRNPGTLYVTKGGDPDSAPDNHQVEITTPSEPLMNGAMLDGRSIVFSSDRAFEVRPNPNSPNIVQWQQLAFGRGLWARWAICGGFRLPKLWVLGPDGIYQYDAGGGEPLNITNADLYPLFPHDGEPGAAVNFMVPPDMTAKNFLRLSYNDGFVIFDYKGTDAALHTLVYDTRVNGWLPYEYNVPMQMHYSEEGDGIHSLLCAGQNGLIYQTGGTTDNGQPIAGRIQTPFFDGGDLRASNYFGDVMIDCASSSTNILVRVAFNSDEISDPQTSIPNGARSNIVVDINGGAGFAAQNIGLDITWPATAGQQFFSWEPAWIDKVEETLKRPTDYDDAGTPGIKYIRGVLIEANTGGVDKPLVILGDGDAAISQVITVNHSVQEIKMYPLTTPFVSHLLRLAPTDATPWQDFRVVWIFDQWPEASTQVSPWMRPVAVGKPAYVRGFRMPVCTNGQPVEFTFTYTLENAGTAFFDLTAVTALAGVKSPASFPLPSPVVAGSVQLAAKSPTHAWYDEIEWDADAWPESVSQHYPFTDLGTAQVKNLLRVTVPIETGGNDAELQLRHDADPNNPLLFPGLHTEFLVKSGVTLSPPAPVIAHEFQLISATDCRVWDGEAKWEFEVWPELTTEFSAWMNLGTPGAKFMRSVVIPVDSNGQSVQLEFVSSDGLSYVTPAFTTVAGVKTPLAFAFMTPFVIHELRIVPHSPCRIWPAEAKWVFDPWPEMITESSNWVNAGSPGDKFFQGFVIPLDTNGAPVTFTVQYPGGSVQAGPFTTTAFQKTPVAFSFPVPFTTHEVELIPSGPCRAWYDEIQWVVEPMPESVTTWKTQPTTHDMKGWQHAHRGYIAFMGTADITMTVTVNGVDYPHTIPGSSGLYAKTLVDFLAVKGLHYQYKFSSSAPFRLFLRDCEIHVKQWGDAGPYRVVNPFGGLSRMNGGAQI